MKNLKLVFVLLAIFALVGGNNVYACGGCEAKVVKSEEKNVDCGGCKGCEKTVDAKDGACKGCDKKGGCTEGDCGSCGTMKVKPASELAARTDWVCCVDKSLEIAKKDNKIVLVDFTYLSDCPFCQEINDKVFTNEKFLSEVKNKYVLCIQNNSSQKPNEVVMANQKKYSTPIGLLAIDKDGTPLCNINWFNCQNDVSKVLNAIEEGVKTGVIKRDENVALCDSIEKAQGEERAKLACKLIDNAGKFSSFYQKSIDLGVQADLENNTGIQGKNGVLNLMAAGFPNQENSKALIEQSDKLLALKNLDKESKNFANATKLYCYFYLGQKAEALKTLENCEDMKNFWGNAFSKDAVKKALNGGCGGCDECPGCE